MALNNSYPPQAPYLGLCQYNRKQLTQGVTEMFATYWFFRLILRDPKPAKFVPVRHKIWADDGSPINPIVDEENRLREEAVRSI
jgi:hypothetical protein